MKYRMIVKKDGHRYGFEVEDPRLEDNGYYTAFTLGHRLYMCKEEELESLEEIG